MGATVEGVRAPGRGRALGQALGPGRAPGRGPLWLRIELRLWHFVRRFGPFEDEGRNQPVEPGLGHLQQRLQHLRRQLHLERAGAAVQPAQSGKASVPWNPTFLQEMAHYDTIRSMDLVATNNDTNADWSTRIAAHRVTSRRDRESQRHPGVGMDHRSREPDGDEPLAQHSRECERHLSVHAGESGVREPASEKRSHRLHRMGQRGLVGTHPERHGEDAGRRRCHQGDGDWLHHDVRTRFKLR